MVAIRGLTSSFRWLCRVLGSYGPRSLSRSLSPNQIFCLYTKGLQPSDEQQILQLFDDGDRALVSGDASELDRIFADDYIQYDESGKASRKQEVMERLAGRAIRYISMVSTGRRIRLFEDFAIVHGSEEDEVEQDGQRVEVKYVYTDIVVKRAGRWQIVGSQLAKPL